MKKLGLFKNKSVQPKSFSAYQILFQGNNLIKNLVNFLKWKNFIPPLQKTSKFPLNLLTFRRNPSKFCIYNQY